jgi:hypothetical protein
MSATHFVASRRGKREIPIPLEFHRYRRSRLRHSKKISADRGMRICRIVGVKELPG